MSTIVTRAGKGSPLTNTEVDANFTNLNTDKLEINAALGTPASVTLTNATGLPTAGLVDNAVTNPKLRDSAGLSVIGRGANSTGDPADIVAGTNKQVLRREGSDLAFGAVDLASNQAVTGTLPVNQGGTGITSFGSGVAAFLGTPSSANLAAAVTDETGTGALVFANSPTLVNPALGTPASGVATNITGLPLTTGVTGTLPVANGGTGITSFGSGVATWLGTPSSANLAAALTDETGTGAAVFGTNPVIDGATVPARTNPLAQAVRVVMTAAESGSNGIQALNNADANFGTGDFTVVWKGSLSSVPPSVFVDCLRKRDAIGWQLFVRSSGDLGFNIASSGGSVPITETAYGFAANEVVELAVVVVRETASVAGSMTLYTNGILRNTTSITAAATQTVSNTENFTFSGGAGTRAPTNTQQAILYNRALSAADVLSLCINGVNLADVGASQVPVYTSDFSAGVDGWTSAFLGALDGNIDGVGGLDDWLRLTTSTTSGQRAEKSLNLPANKNVQIKLKCRIPSANIEAKGFAVRDQNSALLIPLVLPAQDSNEELILNFTPTTAVTNIQIRPLRATGASATAAGDILYFKDIIIKQIGITGQWNAENAQSNTGQIFDTSGNRNHALLPAAGATIIGRPTSQPQQVRWTNTWDGTNELQYIGGTNQAILPANAYIESIVGTVTGATPHDIIIGNGSDTDRYVTITTGLAAGVTSFALASRVTDGTNLKLTVDPDTDSTMSIAWTITYRTLE